MQSIATLHEERTSLFVRIVNLHGALSSILARRPEIVELADLREPLLRLSV